jgi:hypothetical protein
MRKKLIEVLLGIAIFSVVGAAHASVLVSESTIVDGDLNGPRLTEMLGLLNTATGNDLNFVSNLENGAQVAAADAIWLSLRNGSASELLSAAELTNLASFINSGKRVVIIGENASWAIWNNSFLPLVGTTFAGTTGGCFSNAVSLAHELTQGVATVQACAVGTVNAGGIDIFANFNYIDLWGAQSNVLTVLDSGFFRDGGIDTGLDFADNRQFATNIANWLAGSGTPPDTDGDGVLDDDDYCPDNTVIPEGVPTMGYLKPNHWALTDDDGIFDTVSKGKGPNRSYTIEDTAGCSCEQIIEIQGLGDGHTKHGCSISAMDDWRDFVNP